MQDRCYLQHALQHTINVVQRTQSWRIINEMMSWAAMIVVLTNTSNGVQIGNSYISSLNTLSNDRFSYLSLVVPSGENVTKNHCRGLSVMCMLLLSSLS